MGWQPGEGLGRNKEGSLEPLLLDVKTDKKGLVSKDEAASNKAARLINVFQGKHPVSILHELCTKNLWLPPYFEQIADVGPDHLKHFLFKVCRVCAFAKAISLNDSMVFRSPSTEPITGLVLRARPRKKLKPTRPSLAYKPLAYFQHHRESYQKVKFVITRTN